MSLRSQLLAILEELPEDEDVEIVQGEETQPEIVEEENLHENDDLKIDADTPNEELPNVETVDETIITHENMLDNSIAEKFSEFASTIEELKNVVALLQTDVDLIKSHFSTIENNIESTNLDHIDIENFDDIINKIG